MKQFRLIMKFEFKNYLCNKVFIGVTVFLMAAIAIGMFFPRITGLLSGGESGDKSSDKLPVMLLSEPDDVSIDGIDDIFQDAFPDYDVQSVDYDLDMIEDQITSGEAECGFVLDGVSSYTYYVENLSMYDYNTTVADEVLGGLYRMNAFTENGVSAEKTSEILNTQISHETETLGKDQAKNYFYTYIMIFALYMVILLYGQMVATNVANEKSSRAMELLITSAKPTSMMFGKVIASCCAGLLQLLAVFGTSFVCFNLNKSVWDENGVVSSIFDMPLSLLIYMLVFFVLGFTIYAFLFGAVGSTVSRLEDINSAVQPITLLFVAAFMVVMFSLAANNVDSPLMIVCSYLPLTSPMAMFTRIAMSVVPWYSVVISIALLIASTFGIGVLSARIYRVGVLMYGNPPKPIALLRMIKKD
jgi:ABC-2 type transport system permease protein